MPWEKIANQKICLPPLFWSWKEVGSQWRCPDCNKLYTVKANPDRFIGGKILAGPDFTYSWDNPYPSRECRS